MALLLRLFYFRVPLWLVAPGQGSGELEDQRSGGAPPYNRRGHVSELVGDPRLRLGLPIPIRG